MNDKPTVVDLGPKHVARLSETLGELTLDLFSPCFVDSKIVGKTELLALRDFLLLHFPAEAEEPIGTVLAVLNTGDETDASAVIAENARKAAAYDAAVEKAKAISCDRPVTTETTRLVDALASGAFLKEKA